MTVGHEEVGLGGEALEATADAVGHFDWEMLYKEKGSVLVVAGSVAWQSTDDTDKVVDSLGRRVLRGA